MLVYTYCGDLPTFESTRREEWRVYKDMERIIEAAKIEAQIELRAIWNRNFARICEDVRHNPTPEQTTRAAELIETYLSEHADEEVLCEDDPSFWALLLKEICDVEIRDESEIEDEVACGRGGE